MRTLILFSFILFSSIAWSQTDTLTYSKKYTGTIAAKATKIVVFNGVKDATIRLGYSLASSVTYSVLSPSNTSIFTPTGSGVKEIKLSESGVYQIKIISNSTSSANFSFVIYQMTPQVSKPDTLKYGTKYSTQVPYLGKVYNICESVVKISN